MRRLDPLSPLLGAALAACAALAAPSCSSVGDAPAGGAGGSGGGSVLTSGGTGGTSGLPCDVAQVLQAHCLTCHGDPPAQQAPQSLDKYADLVAASDVDPAQTFAQRAVARMQDAAAPMPPAPAIGVTAPEVAVVQAWIDAGYPAGECAGPMPCATSADCAAGQICKAGMCADPLNADPTCTSNQTSFAHEGLDMAPGQACDACHSRYRFGPPVFTFAGTVYPTGHEPDNCVGGAITSQATVVIIDANGQEALRLTPNSVGNFTSTTSVFTPYTAKVVYQGRERVMTTPQQSGDCNACHTQTGTNTADPTNLAPGRITLP